MTPTPQEELKAVKARARKAAAKARADIAKAKQETMVMARDADRARQEALKAREEARAQKEYCILLLELLEKEAKLFENEAKASADYNTKWLNVCREADNLREENARLRRQLKESRHAGSYNINSSKIWEICPN